MSSSNKQRAEEIINSISALDVIIYNPNVPREEREIRRNHRNELAREAGMYGFTIRELAPLEAPLPAPVPEKKPGYLEWVNDHNPFSGGKKKKEEEERQKREQLRRQQEEELRRQRAAQMAAEAAAMEARIRNSAEASRMRINEDVQLTLLEHQRVAEKFSKERELIEQERRADERAERERALLEEDRLRRERERVQKEQDARNAQMKMDFNRKNLQEERRTEHFHQTTQQKLRAQQSLDDSDRVARQVEMAVLNAKVAREREEERRQMEKLEEEIRKTREETRQKFEEMKRKTREQMELLEALMKRAQWSRAIEKNWEIRLKALKSTVRRLLRALSELQSQLAQARIKELNVQVIRKRMDLVKDELAEIVKVMEREAENLDKMYEFSRKPFVLDIANSLRNVSNVCNTFTDYLNSQYQGSFVRDEASVIYDEIDDFERRILAAYREIPTLSTLKTKYFAEWQNFESGASGAITDGSDDGHVVVIEEIE